MYVHSSGQSNIILCDWAYVYVAFFLVKINHNSILKFCTSYSQHYVYMVVWPPAVIKLVRIHKTLYIINGTKLYPQCSSAVPEMELPSPCHSEAKSHIVLQCDLV